MKLKYLLAANTDLLPFIHGFRFFFPLTNVRITDNRVKLNMSNACHSLFTVACPIPIQNERDKVTCTITHNTLQLKQQQ